MMEYRREIDGLRALAVLPVILSHADIGLFRGGFVGVDVFFVISGYLITSIILRELDDGCFSIANFYEKRARRILPALFFVMLATTIAGYFLLMPDEYKNLGQSLVATILFSNNLLLGFTSGYWDLASEFKPLLHTWSLGVEEQYYIFSPLALMLAWKVNKKSVQPLVLVLFSISFLFSLWFVHVAPEWAFYILPTRAWELAAGGAVAVIMRSPSSHPGSIKTSNALSLVGFLLILISIFTFGDGLPIPSYPLLIPVLGSALVLAYCKPGTFVYFVLSQKWIVFTGAISYSLYLWHQPFFAFLRAYLVEKPSEASYLALIPFIYFISFLTWRYVEGPPRKRNFMNKTGVLVASLVGGVVFVIFGLHLHRSYGVPSRINDSSFVQADMDKRIYNERARAYTRDKFLTDAKVKVLVIGNSFARDFINITVETFNTANHSIIYRSDLKQCILDQADALHASLYSMADVIVFASGVADEGCIDDDVKYAKDRNKLIFYVGTKDFGYNLNWVIREGSNRANLYNTIDDSVISANMKMAARVPAENYISLLNPILAGNKIPITDEIGRMLSTDRVHLTKYGAIYFGKRAVIGTPYADVFK